VFSVFWIVLIVIANQNVSTPAQATAAASTPAAAATVAPQSTAEQHGVAMSCRSDLSKLRDAYSEMGIDDHSLFVTVTPAFMDTSFKNREIFNWLARCYYTDGRMDGSIETVIYQDPNTNQTVGTWSSYSGLSFDR
jgi:hypothetical protein